MNPIKPNKEVLKIWRILLTITAIPVAFACSFLLKRGFWWNIASLSWIVSYLIVYLFYFPSRYRAISFVVENGNISVISGVFVKKKETIAHRNVQFCRIFQNPIDKLFDLCVLRINAAGGRISLPGIKTKLARDISRLIEDDWGEP